MADAPYLVALALLEQNGQRAMPLQGKALRHPIAAEGDPGDIARQQAFELLLRIWQRSDTGALGRTDGDSSLLLAEVPIEVFQEQLPRIKADWLNSGDTAALLAQLRDLAGGLWSLKHQARTAPVFDRLQ